MKNIKLNWKQIFDVLSVEKSGKRVQDVLNKYDCVFKQRDDQLNSIQNFKTDVKLRAETEPVFKTARPVPYALKTKVEDNLDKTEREGILKKVTKRK